MMKEKSQIPAAISYYDRTSGSLIIEFEACHGGPEKPPIVEDKGLAWIPHRKIPGLEAYYLAIGYAENMEEAKALISGITHDLREPMPESLLNLAQAVLGEKKTGGR
jgi:hypothetical protein